MSRKNIPAPRGDVAQADVVLEKLRAELREARGALGDLARERKAVEKLARDHAAEVIETHVNHCIEELTSHVNVQVMEYGSAIQRYFQSALDHFMNPGKHGKPDAPTTPEIISAADVINRAIAAGLMKPFPFQDGEVPGESG